jgi:hypothetical protein
MLWLLVALVVVMELAVEVAVLADIGRLFQASHQVVALLLNLL